MLPETDPGSASAVFRRSGDGRIAKAVSSKGGRLIAAPIDDDSGLHLAWGAPPKHEDAALSMLGSGSIVRLSLAAIDRFPIAKTSTAMMSR